MADARAGAGTGDAAETRTRATADPEATPGAATVVHLPRSLIALFPGAPRHLEATGATVADVIADVDARVPGLRNRLVDAGPTLRPHINVFVDGSPSTLDTPVPAGAAVHVIPAVSGG